MPSDSAGAARLRAYALMEAAQGDAPGQALEQLEALEVEARQQGWPEAEFLAVAGQALHGVATRREPALLAPVLDDLVRRAEPLHAPALLGLAHALRAVGAAGRDDGGALLDDAGRALVLVDDPSLPALDRCTVVVVCAAAYNALSLWELSDELFDRASALAPACEEPLQEPAVAVNRVLVRMEWATALFELGQERAALDQLHRAAAAVLTALRVELPPLLWRLDVEVAGELVGFVLQAFGEDVGPATSEERLAGLDRRRDALDAAEDVEMLPLLDALVPLGLLRSGRPAEAAARLHRSARSSSSSGALSFPLWVRAQVLTPGHPDPAVLAHREYGEQVARARWAGRQGMLVAARSRIAGERLSAERDRLARDVLLDPLTGLSNRRCFDDWLATVPDRDRSAALLLVDVDDFKVVNDVYGHAVGDEALRRVGRLVAAHVRPGDLALRLGGDEFAVVLADRDGTDHGYSGGLVELREIAVERARALRESAAATDWGRVAPGLKVGLSVGVAVAVLGPHAPGAADRLYRLADADLYDAKAWPLHSR